jgi:hypothetical protein
MVRTRSLCCAVRGIKVYWIASNDRELLRVEVSTFH